MLTAFEYIILISDIANQKRSFLIKLRHRTMKKQKIRSKNIGWFILQMNKKKVGNVKKVYWAKPKHFQGRKIHQISMSTSLEELEECNTKDGNKSRDSCLHMQLVSLASQRCCLARLLHPKLVTTTPKAWFKWHLSSLMQKKSKHCPEAVFFT